MSGKLRVVHYLNQFFGGVGGEEHANVGVEVKSGPVGPGRALEQVLGDGGTVVATIICGDNFINENQDEAVSKIVAALADAKPDVVIAGPAFDSGRYGLACGIVSKAAQAQGIPAVAAMHPENPGVASYRRFGIIVPTGSSPVEMQDTLSRMASLALRLGSGEELGLPKEEGYIPRGIRKPSVSDQPGYKRAVDLLAAKLNGRPYESEVPFEQPESVQPALPIKDMSTARIALLSTGGLVPKGNPDRQLSGNPDKYFTYNVEGQDTLTPEEWEAFHGGYYCKLASDNPNYVMPLSYMRRYEADGTVGEVYNTIFTLPGVGTPVDKSRGFGEQIAKELKDAGVDGALLVAT